MPGSMTDRMTSRSNKRRDYDLSLPAPNIQQVIEVPITSLLPNPHQPRKLFDAEELQALADSIREEGLLEPIIVYEDDEDGETYIAAGERRKRATELLGRPTIRAIHMGKRSKSWARVVGLLENMGRADLTPFERVGGLAELSRTSGLNNRQLAAKVGLSPAQLSKILTVAKYPHLISELEAAGRDANFTTAYNKAVRLQEDEGETRGRKAKPQPPSIPPASHTTQADPPSGIRATQASAAGRYVPTTGFEPARQAADQPEPVGKTDNRPFLLRGEYVSYFELTMLLSDIRRTVPPQPSASVTSDELAEADEFVAEVARLAGKFVSGYGG